jgi:acetyltransferase-like isoleucine patch superfamily enzyme
MAYLNKEKLEAMGFKGLGSNVKISTQASLYNCDQISIGDNTRIDDFCVISGNVSLGKNVHIAPFTLIAGGEKGIEMGDFSGCAYNVQIFSQSDDYSGRTLTNPTIPSKYKRETKKRVTIGKHVIIGASSIVFPGVDVAEGCSIGAMTLVNKSTTSWGIYVGNPATRIKERKQKLLDLEKQFLKEDSSDKL